MCRSVIGYDKNKNMDSSLRLHQTSKPGKNHRALLYERDKSEWHIQRICRPIFASQHQTLFCLCLVRNANSMQENALVCVTEIIKLISVRWYNKAKRKANVVVESVSCVNSRYKYIIGMKTKMPW